MLHLRDHLRLKMDWKLRLLPTITSRVAPLRSIFRRHSEYRSLFVDLLTMSLRDTPNFAAANPIKPDLSQARIRSGRRDRCNSTIELKIFQGLESFLFIHVLSYWREIFGRPRGAFPTTRSVSNQWTLLKP